MLIYKHEHDNTVTIQTEAQTDAWHRAGSNMKSL